MHASPHLPLSEPISGAIEDSTTAKNGDTESRTCTSSPTSCQQQQDSDSIKQTSLAFATAFWLDCPSFTVSHRVHEQEARKRRVDGWGYSGLRMMSPSYFMNDNAATKMHYGHFRYYSRSVTQATVEKWREVVFRDNDWDVDHQ